MRDGFGFTFVFVVLTWYYGSFTGTDKQDGAALVVSLSTEAGEKKTVNQEMVEQVRTPPSAYEPLLKRFSTNRIDPLIFCLPQGLARVSKRADRLAAKLAPAASTLLADLKEAQEGARRGRLCMWRYGDVADSDDEQGF